MKRCARPCVHDFIVGRIQMVVNAAVTEGRTMIGQPKYRMNACSDGTVHQGSDEFFYRKGWERHSDSLTDRENGARQSSGQNQIVVPVPAPLKKIRSA